MGILDIIRRHKATVEADPPAKPTDANAEAMSALAEGRAWIADDLTDLDRSILAMLDAEAERDQQKRPADLALRRNG